MSELPPFTNRPICRKCGGDRMIFRYQTEGTVAEHMIVECERCHYKWAMQTQDAGIA